MKILNYSSKYEDSWIRGRILSFLYTQYYDDVLQTKPKIDGIELICVENNQVNGLLDIEIKNAYCSYDKHQKGAMIETIAVHPDHQSKGIGQKLLEVAEERMKLEGIEYLEAWTREDDASNQWYIKNGFSQFNSYYHVFTSGEVSTYNPYFHPVFTFGHVTDRKQIDETVVDRIYECRGYVKKLCIQN
ncbi:GNAT family N-acetyltransferase [Macrococcus sp. EM39E]|uniref:GNAT family N-acetyltransferase n=1 Tax=Macrococcus animalis TaxID=3395467 RepID=UPI0039BE6C3D